MALTKITSRILDSSGVTILGTIATGVWQGTAIADDHIASAATWNTASTDRLKWDGGATGLTASTGRTSLGLGTVATTAASDYATAAQGTKADTAHGWGNHTGGGYVKTTTDQTIGGAKTFSSNILIASGEYLSWGTIGATSIEGSTASNKIQFRTGSGNRMIINNTGVGIGTTSPSQQLHLYSGAGGGSAPDSRTKLLIEDNGEAYLGFNVPATSFTGIRLQFAGITKAMFECWDQAAQTPQVRIGSVDSRPVNLQTDNTPRLTVLGTSGNVGIGTTGPDTKLTVVGGTAMTGGWARVLNVESNFPVISLYSSYSNTDRWAGIGYDNTTAMRFWVNSSTADISATTAVMSIKNNGNVGIGSDAPSEAIEVKGNDKRISVRTQGGEGGFRWKNDGGTNMWDLVHNNSTGSLHLKLMTNSTIPLTVKYDSGNVGIGTTSPVGLGGNAKALVVSATSNYPEIIVERLGTYAGKWGMLIGSSATLLFRNYVSGGNVLCISNSDRVGIGTDSPAAKLTVIAGGADGIQLGSDTTSTGNSGRLFFSNTSGGWAFMALGQVLSIRSAATPGSTSGTPKVQLSNYSSTSWTAGSDESIKENIQPIGDVLSKIQDYRCVEYNLIDDPTNDKKIGFIAQDWQTDFPQIVENMEGDIIGMKYTETIPILLKAIQEQQTIIEDLKSRIETLEG